MTQVKQFGQFGPNISRSMSEKTKKSEVWLQKLRKSVSDVEFKIRDPLEKLRKIQDSC